jgi:hypothetical protein
MHGPAAGLLRPGITDDGSRARPYLVQPEADLLTSSVTARPATARTA